MSNQPFDPPAVSVTGGPVIPAVVATDSAETVLPDAKIDAGKAQDKAPSEPPAKPARVPAARKPAPEATPAEPPAGRKAKAAQAAAAGFYRCHVPADSTIPAKVVSATSAGDAERAYAAELGVITFGHPVSCQELPSGG